MRANETLLIVQDIIADVLRVPVDSCLPDSHLRNDLECHSLDRFEIAMSVELRFDIDVPDVDVEEWKTILDVAVTVQKLKVAA